MKTDIYRSLGDKFVEVVASALHHQDFSDPRPKTAEEAIYASDGWQGRYRSNAMFHARVDVIVAGMVSVAIDAFNKELDERNELR
jgi:hypothetical protein